MSTAEVDLATDTLAELLPAEAEAIPRAVAARLHEFRAGRHCGRLALARFGVTGVPIGRAPDRSPLWPAGFVGSITHTRRASAGFCGAAVAQRGTLRSVGIDAEVDEPLEPSLFERILVERELAFVGAAKESERGYLGKLFFSAKECVYKCQYPLSGQFLEFREVEIEIDATRSTFRGLLLEEAGPFPSGSVFEGNFARKNGVIVTAIGLV